VVKEHRIYQGKYFLTIVFASIFLFSFGILVHNAFADQVIATISLGGQHPAEIGANPSTDKIYVTNPSSNQVSVIDGSTDSVVRTIQIETSPWSVAVNPNTDKIYVSNGTTISVIDGTTDSVVSTIPVGSSGEIAVNPNTDKIYVSDYSGKLYVINGATDTITNTIPVRSTAYGVGVNPNTDRIYVGIYRNNTVSVIDGSTNSIVGIIPVGNSPGEIGVNPNTDRIYVPNYADSTVSVLDGSTNSVVATISVAYGPSVAAVNPITNKIYVTNNSVEAVSIINGTTNTVVTNLRVGSYPLGVTVNPNTERIYVANEGFDCGSLPGCTETPQPGTVSVIDGSPTKPLPPATPAGITATPKSSHSITISWTAPATATWYNVFSSTSPSGPFVNFKGTKATSYTYTGLSANTTYYFEVRAWNTGGWSALSSPPVSATTPSPPAVPTGVTATPKSSSTITISWTAPATATWYNVFSSTSPSGPFTNFVGTKATSYTYTGLSAGTTYYYEVRAWNAGGGWSALSSPPVSATTLP
jgi:YVTN family beta-propeller protein